MITGITPFKFNLHSSTFNTFLHLNTYNDTAVMNCTIDEIYIDKNANAPYSNDSPVKFLFTTVLHGLLNGNLEAGNIKANGQVVDYFYVRKRKIDSTKWLNVAKIDLRPDIEYYEIFDRYITLGEDYEYIIVPVVKSKQGFVYGERIAGSVINTHFDGMYLSDKDHNFAFMANLDYDSISHIKPNKLHQAFGSKYPTVVYSELNYSEFTVHALCITFDELKGELNIKSNKAHRQKLIEWLNNGKPKVYKDNRGEIKIVTVADTITENPVEHQAILNDISIPLVEIGDVYNNDDLENFDLLPKV